MIPLDSLIAVTLAHTAREFSANYSGPAAGRAFEQALYVTIRDMHFWQHASGPGQLDMGLLGTSRTGIRYEFDGVFGTDDTLYVIEAKRLGSRLTRELVGVFVQKLLDTILGSQETVGHLRILPVMVSQLPNVDDAAYRLAVAWGILLIAPDRPSPFEASQWINERNLTGRIASQVMHDCEMLSLDLWRSFNRHFLTSGQQEGAYALDIASVYNAVHVQDLIEQWIDSVAYMQELRV